MKRLGLSLSLEELEKWNTPCVPWSVVWTMHTVNGFDRSILHVTQKIIYLTAALTMAKLQCAFGVERTF